MLKCKVYYFSISFLIYSTNLKSNSKISGDLCVLDNESISKLDRGEMLLGWLD